MANKIVELLNKTTKTLQNNAIRKAKRLSYQNVKKQWLKEFNNFNIHDLITSGLTFK